MVPRGILYDPGLACFDEHQAFRLRASQPLCLVPREKRIGRHSWMRMANRCRRFPHDLLRYSRKGLMITANLLSQVMMKNPKIRLTMDSRLTLGAMLAACEALAA